VAGTAFTPVSDTVVAPSISHTPATLPVALAVAAFALPRVPLFRSQDRSRLLRPRSASWPQRGQRPDSRRCAASRAAVAAEPPAGCEPRCIAIRSETAIDVGLAAASLAAPRAAAEGGLARVREWTSPLPAGTRFSFRRLVHAGSRVGARLLRCRDQLRLQREQRARARFCQARIHRPDGLPVR
jgi:hypothetical protein